MDNLLNIAANEHLTLTKIPNMYYDNHTKQSSELF